MSTTETSTRLRDMFLTISNDRPPTSEHLDELCSCFIESYRASEAEQTDHFNQQEREFRAKSYKRWQLGLDLLQVFRHFCVEVGSLFQKEFCQHEQYRHDVLLGVLMRQHANACRVTGEVDALLRSGYPDGALARWRSLHEIAVTSILIRRHGKDAAEDFIRCGLVEAVKGMETYQETAVAMGREPYSGAELDAAKKVKDQLILENKDLNSGSGWARHHVGGTRFVKHLQKAAELSKWECDYKWASQNVHATYRELRALLGMSEAAEDGLLAGPSDSGFTEPAHFSAIALAQTTSAFLTCYIEDEDCPMDFTLTCVAVKAIDHMVEDIGARFLDAPG